MNRKLCLWLSSLILTWVVSFLLKYSWLQSYADDFLFIPIVAGIALLIQQYFTPFFRYPLRTVIMLWIYTCLMFEGVFPIVLNTYTFDWLDIPIYGLGAVFFHLFMNHPINYRKTFY